MASPSQNADTIDAGAGNDTVIAGRGDQITLGDGSDYLELGDWMLNEETLDPARITDFTRGEDILAISHDDKTEPLHIVVEQDEDDGMTEVYVNDELIAIARVSGGALTAQDILVLTYD